MSANLQYADTMSSGLESKLKKLYNRVANQESMPKTINEYVGPVFGGMNPMQANMGFGGRLLGGRRSVGGDMMGAMLVGGRKPRVRPGRGKGSAAQKDAAKKSSWNQHIEELRRERPGLKYKDALQLAKNGATGYIKKKDR